MKKAKTMSEPFGGKMKRFCSMKTELPFPEESLKQKGPFHKGKHKLRSSLLITQCKCSYT